MSKSTASKKTKVKATNPIKAAHAKRTERKHFALGLGVIASIGAAAAYAASAAYDALSEVA